jgi:hypothetical protein
METPVTPIITAEQFEKLTPRQKAARLLVDLSPTLFLTEEMSEDELTGALMTSLGIELDFVVNNYPALQQMNENKRFLEDVNLLLIKEK